MNIFIAMLIIKTDQPNTMVVTVSQNSELTNPEYLFSFTHIFSKQQVNFIPTDISTHKSRYDEFYFVEGAGVGEVNFPYQGLYLYSILEQPSGSGNLNPALATNVVENGEAQIFPSSASSMVSQYDIYISNNEDNSNIIFAPDEPNPSPQPSPTITPTPTSSPIPASPTPTPSITPTFTPTPSITPTYTPTVTPSSTQPTGDNPQTLGALWWIDFTDAATLSIFSGQIATATDKISSIVFSADPGGPIYSATGYLGVSGDVRTNGSQLRNSSGDYGTFSEYTWFGRVYDDVVSQRGGKLIVGTNNGVSWPAGTAFMIVADFNNFPYPPGPVWTFRNRTNTGGPISVDTNISVATWTDIALRSYNSGSDCILEVWENGSVIASGTSAFSSAVSVSDPIFSLMFDGGIDFNTEQFFFDKKLTDTEMGDMFSYLNTKY